MDFAGKATNITVEGVIEKFTNKYIKQDVKTKSERTQKLLHPTFQKAVFQRRGARLSQATLAQDQWTQHCRNVLHGGQSPHSSYPGD